MTELSRTGSIMGRPNQPMFTRHQSTAPTSIPKTRTHTQAACRNRWITRWSILSLMRTLSHHLLQAGQNPDFAECILHEILERDPANADARRNLTLLLAQGKRAPGGAEGVRYSRAPGLLQRAPHSPFCLYHAIVCPIPCSNE
jgi:hypothetical protein